MQSTSTENLVWQAALLLVVMAAQPAFASETMSVDWSHTYLLNDQTAVLPDLRIGFFPSEPAAPSDLDLSVPLTAVISYPGNDNADARILFAIADAVLALEISAPGAVSDGHFEFDVVSPPGSAISVYTVVFDITLSEPGEAIPDTWTSFTPLPAPRVTRGCSRDRF